VALTGLAAALSGCESLARHTRQRDPDVKQAGAASDEPEADKVLGVDNQQDKPKGFFKSSRLPGGLSDESRDIEKSLGVK
jgi:hypothetical protein